MSALFDLNQWFTIRPAELSLRAAGFFALAALVFLKVGVAILIVAGRLRRRDPYLARGERQLGSWFVAWSLAALVWLFFAYEGINFLGARFWVAIALALALVWLVLIARYYLRVLPRLRAHLAARLERERYLPKKKQ